MPWPPLAGRWSVYEASPGTQSGGFWTALTDQTGNGNDITPVVGAVPVLSGYAPGGVTEVCDIGASDVFRAGKSGGWGPFGQGGAIFVKAPWDDSFANESSRFEVRTGGFGTGGAVSTLLQLRHTTGDLCRLWLNPSFAGPGHFGPTWEGIPLAGTGDPAHWIQYAIRWTVDGLITTWRVIVIGDRGSGVQTYVNTTFTQTLDSVTLDRIVTAMYMTQPRGGSIGYWYDEMPDEDFADAVEADAAELDADVSDLFAPGVYACECDEVPAGFDLTLDFAGQIESFASVEGAITETLDLFDLTAGDRSFPCTVTPLTMDVPALIAAGHRLEQATVRVSRAGVLLMVGRPESPRWGRAGEPVRFTVREDPWADSSLWPEGWEQRVTVTDTAAVAEFEAAAAGVPLVSSLGYGYRPSGDDRIRNPQAPFVSALGYEFFVDEVASRVGPMVFGHPGYLPGVDPWPATPAYWVTTTEGSEALLVARQRIPETTTTVTIFGRCVDGEIRGKVMPVANAISPSGVHVALADVSGGVASRPKLIIEATWDTSATYNVTLDLTHITGALPAAAGQTFPVSLDWGGGAAYDDMADALALELSNTFPQAVSITRVDADPIATFTVVLPVQYDLDITAESATGAGAVDASTVNTGVSIAGFDDFDIDFSAEWRVAWTGGEASSGGAGDVIAMLLDQTRIRLDRGRLESWRRRLNGYRLAGYVDAQVNPLEYLASQLAWMPIAWIAGRDGLYAWVYDPETLAQPLTDLIEGETLSVDGDAGLTSRPPVRSVQLAYRHRDDVQRPSEVTTQRTLSSRLAWDGEAEDLTTDLVDDTATAERGAALRQRALADRHLVLTATVDRSLDWLRAGDPVTVSAPSRGVSGVGLVIEVVDTGGARVGLTLAVPR
jgi:hypothetical protein